jgi:glycogen operon protein
MKSTFVTNPGSRWPLGATVYDDGVNFSLASRDATRVELLLYKAHDSAVPFQAIKLDPGIQRTFIIWHVFVEGLKPGVHYTWRVDGCPYQKLRTR